MNDPAQVATAAGWIIPVSILLGPASIYGMGGIFTDIYDVFDANTVWRAGAGLTNAAQNPYAYSYVTSFTVITAALTITRSLQPADMRAAMLSLNGQTTAFSGIEFDNTTGFNTLLVPFVSQAMPSGQYTTTNSSGIVYPYNCQNEAYTTYRRTQGHETSVTLGGPLIPTAAAALLCLLRVCVRTGPWRLPADGDLLDVTQSVNDVLIAVVISVLGAWVALIITEQSVYLKRQGSRYWPVWLFMVALSLGGVSVWCTQVMISTGLQTSLPGSSDALPMSFSFDIAIIALIPSVLLTYAGLLVLMGDVTSISHRSSSNVGQQSLATASEACIARSSEVELVVKTREKQAARPLRSTALTAPASKRDMASGGGWLPRLCCLVRVSRHHCEHLGAAGRVGCRCVRVAACLAL